MGVLHMTNGILEIKKKITRVTLQDNDILIVKLNRTYTEIETIEIRDEIRSILPMGKTIHIVLSNPDVEFEIIRRSVNI